MPRKKKQAKNLTLTFDPAAPPSAEGQALLDALRSNLSLLGEIAARYEVNNKPERPEAPPSIGTPGDIHSLLGPEMSALAQEQLPGDLGHRLDVGGRDPRRSQAGPGGAAFSRRRLPPERLRAPGRPSPGGRSLTQRYRIDPTGAPTQGHCPRATRQRTTRQGGRK